MFDAVPSDAVGYVASAYLFFLLMVLVYIAILGAKFQRISRELGKLIDELESKKQPLGPETAMAEESASKASKAAAPEKEESGV